MKTAVHLGQLTLAAILFGAGCVVWRVLPDREVVFERDIGPILEQRCLECHHRRYEFAGLNLETRQQAMKGGRSGPVIVPGSPHVSSLYRVLLLGHDNPVAMPPTPERLSRDEEQMIHDWIIQGAVWPDGVRLIAPQDWATHGRAS